MAGFMMRKKADMAGMADEPKAQKRLVQLLNEKKGETVRLTLAVPRSLHTRLKLAAVRQELSIVSLVSGWIEEKTVTV